MVRSWIRPLRLPLGALSLLAGLFPACGSGSRNAAAPPPEPAAGEATVGAATEAAKPPERMALKRTAFKFGSGITAIALPPELPAEVEVSVIPLAALPPAVARTLPTRDGKRRLSVIEHASWIAFPSPEGRSTKEPFDLVILFPAVPGAARVDAATATNLPGTLTASTITAAIDRDGDAKADLLFTDWCCGAHTAPLLAGCEATCGEMWSLESGGWTLRERAGANGVAAP